MKYSEYDGINLKALKHIPECSCYNNNWYVGLKRKDIAVKDLIFEKSDDLDDSSEVYAVDTTTFSFELIATLYPRDKGIIHITEEEKK